MEKIPTFFREATKQPGLFPELMPVALAQLAACKIKGLFGYGIFNPMGPTLNMISLLEHPEARNSFIHLRMLSPFLQTSNIFAVLPTNPSKEDLLDIISIAFAQSQNSDTALVASLPTFLLHSGSKDHSIISIVSLRRHVMENRRVFEVQKNLRLLRQFEGRPWDRAAFETKTGLENVPQLLGKAKRAPFKISWAINDEEIKEAQRLRYKVFAEEMGARLPANEEGLDIDEFDAYCDHLLIRDPETLRVIGTYRVLPPHRASQLGRLYSDSEFDLSRINHLRPKMVEVGRSCVHEDYRTGAVIMALWSGLGQYMKQHQYEIMLGCAGIPMADGGHYAASLYNSLGPEQMAPVENHAFPKLPLPLDRLNGGLDVEAPPLIKGYLKLGAKICSAPAWDPDFNTADLLTMLRLSEMNPRYAKHFLEKTD